MSENDFYTSVRVYGKNILLRGFSGGKKIARKVEYRPTYFIPSKEKSKYKTLDGRSVAPIKPGNINDSYDFLKRYEGVANFPIFGSGRHEYTFISDYFEDDIIWDKDKLNIVFLDIECDSENGFPEPSLANEEVTAITMKTCGVFHSFGCGDFITDKDDVVYHKCKDETDLLKKFILFWSDYYPDIVSGWHVKMFDIPYLVNRVTKILGEEETKKLSPWRVIKKKTTYIMDKPKEHFDIYGVGILDYFDLYKKFSPKASQESYKLDHIAFIELGERKLDYSEHDGLHQLYKEDFQKFIEYNIKDVWIVEQIEERGKYSSKLIELALTLAYDNKVNYDDVFQQVRMWDAIIFNHLKKQNIVVPLSKFGEKDYYEGAFVKAPVPGLYNWVVSFDLNSLYPSLIMQYAISPENLVDPSQHTDEMRGILSDVSVESLLEKKLDLSYLKEANLTITPNSQFYKTVKRGFLGDIMDKMYKDRSKYKKLYLEAKKKLESVKGDPEQARFYQLEMSRYNNLQLAKKVCLNSAYGACGSEYFRFYDIRNAEAITSAGRLAVKWIEKSLNVYLNKVIGTKNFDYIIAVDTDSCYLNLEKLVEKMFPEGKTKQEIVSALDKICKERIRVAINSSFEELASYTNAYEQKMEMKRENICDRGIWTAKKRYVLNIWDEEGVRYSEPVIKITGLEAIQSTTPAACRESIKEAIKIILNGTENDLLDFMEIFREKFKTLTVEEISFPTGVNGLAEYKNSNGEECGLFKKGTPIHVKGSLVFNHMLKTVGLSNKYEEIREGEKIKFCYLKEPNPLMNNTIAFKNKLPKEFEIGDFIDYNTQFEKSFLKPMRKILNCVGWKTERQSTLEEFFI